ncbi:uncharacterized protein METZ01_LOCUS328133 [marine metagenome]|uniref:Uncharacterized protein n=1 Tax=marine metagenome TaxID=408172 RepID=A0A382PPJ8_9ZZZZ
MTAILYLEYSRVNKPRKGPELTELVIEIKNPMLLTLLPSELQPTLTFNPQLSHRRWPYLSPSGSS